MLLGLGLLSWAIIFIGISIDINRKHPTDADKSAQAARYFMWTALPCLFFGIWLAYSDFIWSRFHRWLLPEEAEASESDTDEEDDD